MVSLLNFGDSPFAFLFYLVAGIAAAVLLVNIVAFSVSALIDLRTRKVLHNNEK